MKLIKKICGLSLIAFLIVLAAPNKTRAQEGEYVSDQEFYDELDPYGTWVDDPTYGNVWVPDAEDGFRPYATRGHWVVTDYGNTWVSDYPWGWATFHYGRWRYDDYYGWEWIPGHEWAPAWVNWRSGGGYYGWAPLQPGISINLSFGNSYQVPDYYWVCARQSYINRPNIYDYYEPHTRVVNIIHRTTIINNTYVYNKRTYVTGPRINEVRRVTRQNVQVYRVNNVNRPTGRPSISNNRLNIYRPEIRKAPDARPARVVNAAEYRKEHPNEGIAHRVGGQATVNRGNAARLAQVAKSNDNKLVKVNNNRPVRQTQPDNKRPEQPNARPGQPANQPTGAGQRTGKPDTKQVQQQQAAQRQQQQEAQRQQQQEEQRKQQGARRQQQSDEQKQQVAQRQQQQEAQRQQQSAQRQQQQETQRQQQQAQRQQQQEAQRQQQAAQRQQQQEAQRQQQSAQRQQQQEAQRQQQQAQRQQQQEAQRQQQQQRQQEAHRTRPQGNN